MVLGPVDNWVKRIEVTVVGDAKSNRRQRQKTIERSARRAEKCDLLHPDQSRSKVQEAQEATIELLIADKEPSPPLNFVDKAFNEMTCFVQMLVIVSRVGPVAAWWDNRLGPNLIKDESNEVIRVIRLIGDHIITLESLQQACRLHLIVPLSTNSCKKYTFLALDVTITGAAPQHSQRNQHLPSNDQLLSTGVLSLRGVDDYAE